MGLLGRRPVLPGAAAFFIYPRPGLGAAAGAEANFSFAESYKFIFGADYLETEGSILVLRPVPAICNAQSPLGAY